MPIIHPWSWHSYLCFFRVFTYVVNNFLLTLFCCLCSVSLGTSNNIPSSWQQWHHRYHGIGAWQWRQCTLLLAVFHTLIYYSVSVRCRLYYMYYIAYKMNMFSMSICIRMQRKLKGDNSTQKVWILMAIDRKNPENRNHSSGAETWAGFYDTLSMTE